MSVLLLMQVEEDKKIKEGVGLVVVRATVTSSQMSFSAFEVASVWHISPSVHVNFVDPAVQSQPEGGALRPSTHAQKNYFPRDKNNHYTATQDKTDAPTRNTQNATCVNCKHTESLQCF